MSTEDTGTGFFSRLKNVFSSSSAAQHSDDATETLVATADESPVNDLRNDSEVAASAPNEQLARNWEGSVTETEITLRTVQVSAPAYTVPTEKDLDIAFATKFVEAGGKFIFCESIQDAVENLRMLKGEQHWDHIFCWENEIKDAFCNNNFQKGAIGFTIENSDAAISLCESLVADEGIVILNPKQASRRRLPGFPKTHIIITDIAHLVATENAAVELFQKRHKGELPSVIKLGSCNSGHFYDKQRLILNSEGPEDVYVFLVDEIIPPSLRP
ncbi:MAG TPA: LUD domain-containing protein [Chitinophagales bacterium]|nr:LUD domain-containing protein [Chitinophagales bacterium]